MRKSSAIPLAFVFIFVFTFTLVIALTPTTDAGQCCHAYIEGQGWISGTPILLYPFCDCRGSVTCVGQCLPEP